MHHINKWQESAYLAVTLALANTLWTCKKVVEEGKEKTTEQYRILLNRGLDYHDQKKYEEAIQHYQEAIDLKPSSYQAWNNIGAAYNSLTEYEKAIDALLKAIELKPDFHQAWNNMGMAYARLGEPEQAIELYEKAAELEPSDHRVWLNIGLTHVDLHQNIAAITYFEKAMRASPDDSELRYRIGGIYVDLGNECIGQQGYLRFYYNAIEAYEEAFRIKLSNNPKDWDSMGIAYYHLERYQEALKAYRKAVAIKVGNHQSWNNMGIVYDDLREHRQAIKAYQEAIKIKQDFHEAWGNMGMSYLSLKEYEESIEATRKALELKPDFENAWYALGLAYVSQNRGEDFERALERSSLDPAARTRVARRLGSSIITPFKEHSIPWEAPDPNDPETLYRMAMSRAEGDPSGAIERYRQIIKLKPDFHEAWYQIGLSYTRMKPVKIELEAYDILPGKYTNEFDQHQLYQKAIEAYQKAVKIKPNYYEAWISMGDVYTETKEPQKTIDAYRMAIGIAPKRFSRWREIGRAYLQQGRLKAFRSLLEKNLDPDTRAHIMVDTAKYCIEIGRQSHAIEAYRLALQDKPRGFYRSWWYDMGEAYLLQGRLEEFEALLEEKKINPIGRTKIMNRMREEQERF